MAEAVKRAMPDARVTFVAQEYTAGLVRLSPFVDDVIEIAGRDIGWRETDAFSRGLRGRGMTAALFAYPRPALAFAAWRARIPLRTGTAYRVYSPFFNRKVREHRKEATRHERDYNLSLLSAIGIPVEPRPLPVLRITDALRGRADEALQRAGVESGRRFIVLHPGSGGSARDWDAQHFSELAGRLARGIPDTAVLVTGSESERGLTERVASTMPGTILQLRESLSLPELAALLSQAALCIANSTGPLHIAAAVQVPVLGLYPFERVCHPVRWGPLGPGAQALTPEAVAGCEACARRTCPEHDTMDRITVDRVYAAATLALSR
ncbi:MAG: glycosyltransferase family 9 protein [Ignavibacteria bacterium]|nr:glycosyltransferase family 9 protein [Ignavibacteria bacterium]